MPAAARPTGPGWACCRCAPPSARRSGSSGWTSHSGRCRRRGRCWTASRVAGYEIRQGSTEAIGAVEVAVAGGRGWARGGVLGISVHGVLEEPEVLRALFGAAPERSLDAELDHLTDAVTDAIDISAVEAIVGG